MNRKYFVPFDITPIPEDVLLDLVREYMDDEDDFRKFEDDFDKLASEYARKNGYMEEV